VAKRETYINQVPGEDASRDAFNILQAVRNDDLGMVRMIMEHQTTEWGAEDILATTVAWLMLALKAMPAEHAEHIIRHFRLVSEMTDDERAKFMAHTGA
jgi:hypothetical protein